MTCRRRPDRARPVLVAAFLLAWGLAGRATGQAPKPAEPKPTPVPLTDRIEAAVTAEMTRLGIPGLSLALATSGEVRLASGYGLADVENGVPARAATVYRLASVSKPITAVAALQLHEKGLLDLDAPVQKYVPSFPAKTSPVSVRQLLAHLGGIRHYRPDEPVNTRRWPTITDALELFRDDPLVAEPGTRFVYSTYGYNLAGAAVEGAAAQPFFEVVEQSVLVPAGMEHTRPDDPAAIIPNRAQGYYRDGNGELRNSAMADVSYKLPGGGFCAPAEDMARFALALSAGRLLKKETIALMLTPARTRSGRPTAYGLGWNVRVVNRHREAWHTGGQERVSTVLYWRPDDGDAVVLLTNLEGVQPPLVELARKILELSGR